MRGKRNHPYDSSSLQGTHQTERMFSHSATSKVARLFAMFQRLAMRVVPAEHGHTEFGLFKPPETTSIFLTQGDTTISFGIRKNFLTHRMIVEPRNKVEI